MELDAAPVAAVSPCLHLIRGHRVILDHDLARLFDVSTKRLNEQVRRNRDRFPVEFAFQLTPAEAASLRSQIVTSNAGRGGRRYRPFAFTEHGVVMAANVVSSRRAVAMSVEVVKAFIRLRKAARTAQFLRKQVARLGKAVRGRLAKHDAEIELLFKTLESFFGPARDERPAPKRIGFTP